MPPRSTIDLLPEPLRGALDRRIIASAFGSYAAHAAWLAEQGHPASVDAVNRYGRRLRASVNAERARMQEASATAIAHVKASVEAAKALREAAGDDPLLIGEATGDLLISRLYDAAASGELDAKQLQTLTRTLQESIRTSVAIRKERALDREKTLREAAAAAVQVMHKRGISKSLADSIRAAIEGSPRPQDDAPERPRALPQETLTTIRRDVYGIHEPAAD